MPRIADYSIVTEGKVVESSKIRSPSRCQPTIDSESRSIGEGLADLRIAIEGNGQRNFDESALSYKVKRANRAIYW